MSKTLTKHEPHLPDTINELKSSLLYERERYNVVQRKKKFIDKTQKLNHQRKQVIEEGIIIGRNLLLLESKIGKLLKDTLFKKNRYSSSIDGTTTLQELGFSKTDSHRFQKIYQYQYTIDEYINECVSSETLPSRQDLLLKIKDIEKTRQRLEMKSLSKNFIPIENLTLINDEFQNIELTNVDCVLTDPPYLKEYLPLYDDLRDFSERVLRPSGFLIFYIYPQILNDVILKMSKSKSLSYYWNASLVHTGSTGVYHFKSIFNQHKLLLIYQKNPVKPTDTYFKDVIMGSGREKDYHDWQQSGKELETLIETFTNPNDTIVDCCAGSGTTGIQTLSQGRKSILIEKDKDTFDIMKHRLYQSFSS